MASFSRAPRSLIEAPSNLGLAPSGVELLPDVFAELGFAARLGIADRTRLAPPAFSQVRDAETRVLNPNGIFRFSGEIADLVEDRFHRDLLPIVLGGDCSVLLGIMLGLKRSGRFGLAFLDAHTDCYRPEHSPTGQVADMELGILLGGEPEMLSDMEGLAPSSVFASDVVACGFRDEAERQADGCEPLPEGMLLFSAEAIKEKGAERVGKETLKRFDDPEVNGFWIHLDADVIADDEMPAVDYRLPGGISSAELRKLLATLFASEKAVGLSVTIYNPNLDPSRDAGPRLVDAIVGAFEDLG